MCLRGEAGTLDERGLGARDYGGPVRLIEGEGTSGYDLLKTKAKKQIFLVCLILFVVFIHSASVTL